MITLNRLVKSFGDTHVLRELDLTIKDGETMVVIGASGCGKSVLLKCIMGLLKVESGSIMVGDMDVTRIGRKDLYDLRKRFGINAREIAIKNLDVEICVKKHAEFYREVTKRL